MTTTATPATMLDMRDVYRGPMDPVIEEAPSACLYEYEVYPEEQADAELRKEFQLTWADEAAGEQQVLSYDETLVAAPVDQLNFEEMAALTEPEVVFVADNKGSISPMACAYMLVKA
jgi:hypothetical protein